MARLIEASTTVTELFHRVYLSNECKEDIFMWTKLLSEWNGVSMFHTGSCVSNLDLTIFTDSCSTVGFGAFHRDNNEAFYDTWKNHPLPVTSDAMSYLELYPIVVSCIVWGSQFARKRIKFMCDNEGTVAILKKGRSSCKNINKLMRSLAIIATKCNFTFTSEWLSTKVNLQADALSRGNISMFQELSPHATIVPCPTMNKIMSSTTRHSGIDPRD